MPVDVRVLQNRSDFLRLKAEGKRAFRQGFVMQWQVVDAPGVGVGYTASIKGVGNAVRRNRARRRLRAAVDVLVRLNPQVELPVKGKGLELALIAKDTVLTLDFDYLVKDLRSALHEAGLTC